jgi:hypothetical protein
MPQLLPDGLLDPALSDPIPSENISYGETWGFHLGTSCACEVVVGPDAASSGGPHLAVSGSRALRLTGVETLVQWIRMALATDRYRYPIFNNQYGSEFTDIIASSLDADEAETEIVRTIREALLIDPRIQTITSVDIVEHEENAAALIADIRLVTFAGDVSHLRLDLSLSEG